MAAFLAPVEQTKVQQQLSIRFKQLFNDLFSQVQEIIGFQHKPTVDLSIAPKAQACWRVPSALQAEVVSELERMITEGKLEPIDACR